MGSIIKGKQLTRLEKVKQSVDVASQELVVIQNKLALAENVASSAIEVINSQIKQHELAIETLKNEKDHLIEQYDIVIRRKRSVVKMLEGEFSE